MPNNDDQLQQQYQEILNKYASSLEPVAEPVSEPVSEPQTPILENLMPKLEPKPEFVPPVEGSPIPKPEPEVLPPKEEILPPIIKKPITPPIYFPPEPIVSTDKPSNFFKYLFYFSLIVFIVVVFAIGYSFLNSQQPVDLSNTPPTSSPSVTASKFCELNDKKYAVGESFPSADKCNTCSCTSNLTIACTEMACASPTAISTPKPVSGKLYKDIKYGYQFTCPTGAKYVLEATSVNGNKIPFKQESCTMDNSVATISVYDNTIVHSFGNVKTIVSTDKKFIYTLEGNYDNTINSFKTL